MSPQVPKRILFSVRPGYGHVYPLLPLARAFRAAGHAVDFATAGEFVPRLCRLGFATHRAGLTIKQGEAVTTQRPELVGLPPDEIWRFGAVMFGRVLPEATVAHLVPLLVAIEPDLVVYEEFDLGGALAARATGIPAVSHALGRQPADIFRAPVIAELARVWSRVSTAPFVDPFMTDPHIDISPPALRDAAASTAEPVRRIFQRPVAQTDTDTTLPEWIRTRPPRALVYVTLGTIVFEAVHSLRAVIDGLARLDVDVLVTVGPNGDVAKLGPAAAERSRRTLRAAGRADGACRRSGAPLRERHDARFPRSRRAAAGDPARCRPVHERGGVAAQRRRITIDAGRDHAGRRRCARTRAAR